LKNTHSRTEQWRHVIIAPNSTELNSNGSENVQNFGKWRQLFEVRRSQWSWVTITW